MKRCCIGVLLALTACQEGMEGIGETDQEATIYCPKKAVSCGTSSSTVLLWNGVPFTAPGPKEIWIVQDNPGGGYYARLVNTGAPKIIEAWKVQPSDGGQMFQDLGLAGMVFHPRPPLPPPPPIVDWDKLAIETAMRVFPVQDESLAVINESCPAY